MKNEEYKKDQPKEGLETNGVQRFVGSNPTPRTTAKSSLFVALLTIRTRHAH